MEYGAVLNPSAPCLPNNRGVATCRTLGIVNQRPLLLGLLAGTRTQAGHPNEALPLLTEALALIERTQERWFEVELHRLKAEALLAPHSLTPPRPRPRSAAL
jgi:hypothetical protein